MSPLAPLSSRPRRHARVLRLAVLLATTLAAVACGGGSASLPPATTSTPAPPAAAAFPRTVTDSSGTQVRLAAPARRVISLSPGLTEVLYAIGAGDRVVATDRFSDYPAAAAQTPKLEYSSPSAEATFAHAPDLVIMTGNQKPQVAQFRALGLPVLYLEEAPTVQAVLEHIALLGTLTAHDRAAQALVAAMRQRIEAVTAKLSTVTQGPRVFYELSPDLYTAAAESFIGGMLTLLKAQNAAQGATSAFPQLSAEAVIAFDPEVVLLTDAVSAKQSAETVAARPGWAHVAAVQRRRIHPIDADLVNRPGPRIAEGLETMARLLYPEQFR
ncbi:MAG: ABC transporter substrate-binding protein [Dehalococcoidia bacterium]|nr:ABC transporter substrate-binding protein [Dehalococcoidia bacterium]